MESKGVVERVCQSPALITACCLVLVALAVSAYLIWTSWGEGSTELSRTNLIVAVTWTVVGCLVSVTVVVHGSDDSGGLRESIDKLSKEVHTLSQAIGSVPVPEKP